MKKLLLFSFFLSFCLISTFSIDLKVTKKTGSVDESVDIANEIRSNIEDAGLDENTAKQFNRNFANSTAAISRGLGLDYANTTFKYFTLSASVSAALSPCNNIHKLIEEFSEKEVHKVLLVHPPAIGATATLGLDMHYAKNPVLKKFKFFLNFFTIDASKYLNNTSANVRKTSISSFGFHFLYPLMTSKSSISKNVFYWGGINISGGLDYVENHINTDIIHSITVNGKDAELRANARMRSRIFTLPIEVSTNIRMIHILSLFGGLGTDFTFGKAYVEADGIIDEQVTGTIYDVNAKLGERARPSLMNLRFFAGTEINLYVLHVLAKIEYSVFAKSLSAQAGISIGY